MAIKEKDGIILFGLKNIDTFQKELKKENSFLFAGISYCQKPPHCRVRFSPLCHECGCFVGKTAKASRYLKDGSFRAITTTTQLALDILETIEKYPNKELFFLISACPLSIKMFKKWAAIFNLRGVALPLRGEVCATNRDFKKAEKGIKPGKTVLCKENETLFLNILKLRSCTKSPL